jgi:predicted 3-demethylubiquinone-9 3-methyltransferase (glyoxalase superfamily)
MPKITPCLWFESEAEEAANFYVSVFRDSKVLHVSRFGDAGPGPKGKVLSVVFEIDGQRFTAINGGPQFNFTEAVSFQIDCRDQAEVDHFWDRLVEGGQESRCGWLKDRFGLSWQVIPAELPALIGGPDPVRSQQAMRAMLQMRKLDVARLKAAYEAEPA